MGALVRDGIALVLVQQKTLQQNDAAEHQSVDVQLDEFLQILVLQLALANGVNARDYIYVDFALEIKSSVTLHKSMHVRLLPTFTQSQLKKDLEYRNRSHQEKS